MIWSKINRKKFNTSWKASPRITLSSKLNYSSNNSFKMTFSITLTSIKRWEVNLLQRPSTIFTAISSFIWTDLSMDSSQFQNSSMSKNCQQRPDGLHLLTYWHLKLEIWWDASAVLKRNRFYIYTNSCRGSVR